MIWIAIQFFAPTLVSFLQFLMITLAVVNLHRVGVVLVGVRLGSFFFRAVLLFATEVLGAGDELGMLCSTGGLELWRNK